LDYVSVAVVAALVTYSSTFIVRKGSQRLGFVVKPGGRMIHTQPTPTLGGVAMFVGFIVAMAINSNEKQE
jgi:UDP-GlcNAc:undecaprenyl-phosphate GlcNAc-1-phosphate transferase